MADKTVDARGLSCPEPVLLVMEAVKGLDGGTIDVMVDTATSCENVVRMAESLSCTVKVTDAGEESFVVHVEKD